MIWQQLIKAALIGTTRSALPPTLTEALNEMGIDPDLTPEHQLLHAAAIYSRMQKVGAIPLQWTAPLDNPSDTTDQGICSREGNRLLGRILNGEYPELLEEFIRNLEDRNLFLPPESLPGLLQRAVEDKALWEALKSVIGKRGFWLIQLNPAWKPLSSQHKPEVWAIGNKTERLAFLQYMRKNAPAKAIELLQESWEEEGHQDRIQFVKCLAINLQASDEEFLEQCLDSKRKDLRKEAGLLLAQLPDSSLLLRMKERMDELVEIKKTKVVVKLPDQLDKTMVRDGIDPRKQWQKGGVKASRFLQIMALVPPAHWVDKSTLSIEAILKLFAKSEWNTLLIEGILEASCLHQDEAWMEALLIFWTKHYHQDTWEDLKMTNLLQQLPAARLNPLIIQQLKKNPSDAAAESPIVQQLRLTHFQWEDPLTMQFIKNLKRWINSSSSRSWGHWHLRELLQNAAYRCRPELYDYFQKNWPRNDDAWSGWYDEIEEFLYVLKFRKRMKEVI